jgi:hypothetical protein
VAFQLLNNITKFISLTYGIAGFTVLANGETPGNPTVIETGAYGPLYLTPAASGAINGAQYNYYAQSQDGTQTEQGIGTWNSSTNTLLRTKVTATSDNSLIVNFTIGPVVDILGPVTPDNPLSASNPLQNYLTGLQFSTQAGGGSQQFSVSAGQATDSTNMLLMNLPAMTKVTGLAGFTLGSGGGALDTGNITPSTEYYGYVISSPNGNVVDFCISLSPTAPTLSGGNIPVGFGFTLYRRVFAMRTDASSHWVDVRQVGDKFYYAQPIGDLTAFTGYAAVTPTLTSLTVPSGIHVEAMLDIAFSSATAGVTLLAQPGFTSFLGASVAGLLDIYAPNAGVLAAAALNVMTDTSARISIEVSATSTVYIVTRGWVDRRGRDG